MPSDKPVTYARRLGLFSGTMSVVGGIIGSGIFLNPAIVAQRTGTATLTMVAWVLGGVVALLGAFVYAELGSRFPKAGGGYVYLRDAFGPLPAFLSGWVLLLAVATGAIAAVAVTFANYLLALTGGSPSLALPIAGAAVVVLTAVNIAGVAPGAYTQNVFTVLKLAGIAALVAVALRPGPVLPPPAVTVLAGAAGPAGAGQVIAVLGMALSPILFSYGGWQQTNYIAEEIRDPERTLPRALVLGVIIVVIVYLMANVAYLRALGIDGLAASSAPAADAMERTFGAGSRKLISVVILVSTFGFLDLVILVSPRVYQAMAADGLFPAALARLHPRTRTPVIALVAQCLWALALVSLGTYGELLDWVVFADWLTFGSVAATLLVYRRRSGRTRYQAPLYPVSVVFFIGAAVYVIGGSVASNPGNALRGTLLLASGVPVYLFWRSRSRVRKEAVT